MIAGYILTFTRASLRSNSHQTGGTTMRPCANIHFNFSACHEAVNDIISLTTHCLGHFRAVAGDMICAKRGSRQFDVRHERYASIRCLRILEAS